MTTAFFFHPDGLGHVTPPEHPEQVARLNVIANLASKPEFSGLLRPEVPLAPDAALLRCHPQRYLDRVAAAAPARGWAELDSDTHVMAGSERAARRAVGAAVAAVDLVLTGGADNAFVAMRPPGHHAERETAMGFCLYGTVAVAAQHALAVHGLRRVVIMDFDVHHGNGTQDLLWDQPGVLFVSTHQSPLYPGTGARSERGAHDQIVNLPLPQGTDGPAYRAVFEAEVIPAIAAARPDLILLSAGFDAHRADPLAEMNLETEDFAWITDRLCALAQEHCGGKLVSCLEGGYDLPALGDSVAAHLRGLMAQHDAAVS
ncbi:histone deacetylase family protein [Pseudoruegeria sp. SK021]|uniref:histone deacetylase family protein n=1 Tax=Pseudoruegeria sp. SK021 TaxID=1933035 RepID=UPI000A265D98|nr:histone deacetylase family protein [Pseudoruegeria sp. SK021]OSP54447.1 acetoin utilization protein [Pseudoruegeria sp. SK021]